MLNKITFSFVLVFLLVKLSVGQNESGAKVGANTLIINQDGFSNGYGWHLAIYGHAFLAKPLSARLEFKFQQSYILEFNVFNRTYSTLSIPLLAQYRPDFCKPWSFIAGFEPIAVLQHRNFIDMEATGGLLFDSKYDIYLLFNVSLWAPMYGFSISVGI